MLRIFLGVFGSSIVLSGLIDRVIYGTEDFLADDMLVIVRPTSNDRVEFRDQFSSRRAFVRLHDVSDLFQECLSHSSWTV